MEIVFCFLIFIVVDLCVCAFLRILLIQIWILEKLCFAVSVCVCLFQMFQFGKFVFELSFPNISATICFNSFSNLNTKPSWIQWEVRPLWFFSIILQIAQRPSFERMQTMNVGKNVVWTWPYQCTSQISQEMFEMGQIVAIIDGN